MWAPFVTKRTSALLKWQQPHWRSPLHIELTHVSHTRACACMHTCMHTHTCMYTRVWTCLCTCTCTRVHACAHAHISGFNSSWAPRARSALGASGAEIIPGKCTHFRTKPLPLTNGHGRCTTATPERAPLSVGEWPSHVTVVVIN